MSDLPQEAYDRVAALRNSYRQRLAMAEQCAAENAPVEKEAAQAVSEAEARNRQSIESAEASGVKLIMERWNRRGSALGMEFAVIKERKEKKAATDRKLLALQKNFYREQFLCFWSNVKKEQLAPRDTEVTRLLSSVYKDDMVPFAADPVECWRSGIVVPPEMQRSVELRDRHGAVSLPPYHELSMKLRDAYDHDRAGKSPTMVYQKSVVSGYNTWEA